MRSLLPPHDAKGELYMAPKGKKSNPLDLLKTPTPAKKKGKKSIKPRAECPELADSIANFLEAQRAEKEASARKKIAEAEIRPIAEDAKADACQKAGSYDSSIILNGKVMVTAKSQYKDTSLEEEDMLRRIFGDADYDKFFGVRTKVAFSKELMDDEEKLTEVLGAIQKVVGGDFARFFDVKTTISPTEAYTKGRICNPDVREKAKKAEAEDLCVPYNSTLKPSK